MTETRQDEEEREREAALQAWQAYVEGPGMVRAIMEETGLPEEEVRQHLDDLQREGQLVAPVDWELEALLNGTGPTGPRAERLRRECGFGKP